MRLPLLGGSNSCEAGKGSNISKSVCGKDALLDPSVGFHCTRIGLVSLESITFSNGMFRAALGVNGEFLQGTLESVALENSKTPNVREKKYVGESTNIKRVSVSCLVRVPPFVG